MDTKQLKTMFVRTMYIVVIMVVTLSVSTTAYAAPSSPFLGHWEATDVDGSDMNLAIGGPATGPFQITWTDDYISFCGGESGIVRGTGWLNTADPNLLDAHVLLECFTTGDSLPFDVTFRYHPTTNTLSIKYSFGQVTIWHRPGGGQAEEPPALGLRVNYGHDWVESFYEAGHTVWISITDGDGNLKATAELVTEPKWYWGDETGFQSVDGVWLDGEGNPMEYPPDIQPYDWVFGWVDNGASAQVQIGEIQGVIDLETDSIRGTVLADWFAEELYVICDPWGLADPSQYRESSAYPDGTDEFECSWSGVLDFELGQELGVWYYGSDGNAVANAFSTSWARIHASVTGDFFFATDFNPGTLSISINESAQEGAALLWSGEVETDETGFVHISPNVHGLDLMPGNYLVISDGRISKGLVLEMITLDVFDTEHDIMAGTAPAGSEVMVVAAPGPEWEVQTVLNVLADPETGAWLADFSSIGFDITEEMREWSFASIFDEDGDTNETSSLPAPPIPTFVAYMPVTIVGYNWPIGDAIDLSINDGEYTAQAIVGNADWDPTVVLFELWRNDFFMEAGDYIVMTDEAAEITKEVWVTNLAVTDFDLNAGKVFGTYDPAYDPWVWLYDLEGQVPETDPDNGAWVATFTELPLGAWGGATQWDTDGDGTSIDFQAPGGAVGNFLIEWSQTNPEEVIYLSWNGSDNLVNTGTNPWCSGDLEFFGNSWVSENEGTDQFFFASLVGWGTTGTWAGQAGTQVNIDSISSSCPGSADIPIHTQYQFIDGKPDLIMIQRTFEFGDVPYTHDVRPFIPRLYPWNRFTQVLHPNATSDALMTETASMICDFGCVAESWNGSWFAIHDPVTGQGMIVQSLTDPIALWLDNDGASFTNSSSILLLPPDGGFTGTVTETEYLCFYDSSIWTPSLALPESCQP